MCNEGQQNLNFWDICLKSFQKKQISELKVKTSYSFTKRKSIRTAGWARWHMPVVPATQEAEAGELPNPGAEVAVSRDRAIALQPG